MDPNTALEEIRALRKRGDEARTSEDAAVLYGEALERFAALDEWLGRGGFLPAEWSKAEVR